MLPMHTCPLSTPPTHEVHPHLLAPTPPTPTCQSQPRAEIREGAVECPPSKPRRPPLASTAAHHNTKIGSESGTRPLTTCNTQTHAPSLSRHSSCPAVAESWAALKWLWAWPAAASCMKEVGLQVKKPGYTSQSEATKTKRAPGSTQPALTTSAVISGPQHSAMCAQTPHLIAHVCLLLANDGLGHHVGGLRQKHRPIQPQQIVRTQLQWCNTTSSLMWLAKCLRPFNSHWAHF